MYVANLAPCGAGEAEVIEHQEAGAALGELSYGSVRSCRKLSVGNLARAADLDQAFVVGFAGRRCVFGKLSEFFRIN